jgi:uncharacterized protein YidB (DUF937 family)
MDLNDIISMGTNMLKDKLGDNVDTSSIQDALGGLFSNEEGGFDLSNIMSSLTSGEGGIASIVTSWIGSGDNEAIDGEGLSNILGSDAISSFADKLGIDSETAANSLSDVVPDMVDKATGDGSSILDSIGGVDGLMDMAGKFFGKS